MSAITQHVRPTPTRRAMSAAVFSSVVGVVAFTLLSFLLLRSYLGYLDDDAPGTGIFLVGIFIPACLVVFGVVTLLAWLFCWWRRARLRTATLASFAAMFLVLVAAFTFEVCFTADYPTEQPVSVGQFLARFLRHPFS